MRSFGTSSGKDDDLAALERADDVWRPVEAGHWVNHR
jgi:hypothetical protein